MADSSSPPRKTNVLILASSLFIGGAETVMRHLAHAIDRKRFNVTVCHLKHGGHLGPELTKAGIDVVGIMDSEATNYLTSLKLRKVIRDRQIDVVHTHTTHGLVDACICKLLKPGLRVVHTFHFGNYPHTRPRIMWMERVFSRFANRLFSVGEVQRRQLRAVYGFSDRAITTIWNGVELATSTGDPTFRSRVGADNKVLVGTIATLITQKGLQDLLRTARRVLDAGHNARFVIVGEGVLRPELEALRHELGLDNDVVLTGWVTGAADLALPVFDIFYQPSLWEAMSVVILEAMAASKAIVATRVGENPHVIEDGVDGLLVDAQDIDGMAATLGRLIDDADLRQRLGAAARRKVEDRFTVQHMTSAYEAVYLDRT